MKKKRSAGLVAIVLYKAFVALLLAVTLKIQINENFFRIRHIANQPL